LARLVRLGGKLLPGADRGWKTSSDNSSSSSSSSAPYASYQGLLRRVKWRQTASSLSQGGGRFARCRGTQSVMCAMHLAHDFRVCGNSKRYDVFPLYCRFTVLVCSPLSYTLWLYSLQRVIPLLLQLVCSTTATGANDRSTGCGKKVSHKVVRHFLGNRLEF